MELDENNEQGLNPMHFGWGAERGAEDGADLETGRRDTLGCFYHLHFCFYQDLGPLFNPQADGLCSHSSIRYSSASPQIQRRDMHLDQGEGNGAQR